MHHPGHSNLLVALQIGNMFYYTGDFVPMSSNVMLPTSALFWMRDEPLTA